MISVDQCDKYDLYDVDDDSYNKYIKIHFERGGMDMDFYDFIKETFNVIYHTTES